tara:strand:- start:2075 stop:2560 length:486 start_codon:yes stop_codon:yes gene_type:complete
VTAGGEQALRSCGDCTACCQGWLRSELLDMRPGKPCRHCSAQGCAIYAERPQDPCIDFTCAWLHPESGLPEDMRPDRCGAIVKWRSRWRGWETVSALPVGEKIPDATLRRLVDYARERQQPIIFLQHEVEDGEFTGSRHLATGTPAFIAQAKNGLRTEDVW